MQQKPVEWKGSEQDDEAEPGPGDSQTEQGQEPKRQNEQRDAQDTIPSSEALWSSALGPRPSALGPRPSARYRTMDVPGFVGTGLHPSPAIALDEQTYRLSAQGSVEWLGPKEAPRGCRG